MKSLMNDYCILQTLCVQKTKQYDDTITPSDPKGTLQERLDPVGHQLLQTGDNCGKCSSNWLLFLEMLGKL